MNQELLQALLSVQPGRYCSPNADWRILFDYYNNNLKDGEHRLGMGCQPCFDKVYTYCRMALLAQLQVKQTS